MSNEVDKIILQDEVTQLRARLKALKNRKCKWHIENKSEETYKTCTGQVVFPYLENGPFCMFCGGKIDLCD